MVENKIFVGSGKSKFNGQLISCSICLTDLPQEHMFEYKGKKYIKLNIGEKKEGVDQYGKTHHVSIDTFNPETQDEPAPKAEPEGNTTQEGDDLPF